MEHLRYVDKSMYDKNSPFSLLSLRVSLYPFCTEMISANPYKKKKE